MNKLIFNQDKLTLSTSVSFVETASITIPSPTSGFIIARISGIGQDTREPDFGFLYVSEALSAWNKDDSGILTLGYFNEINKPAYYPADTPSISFEVNSNNLRVRVTRNSFPEESYWMIDMDIFYI